MILQPTAVFATAGLTEDQSAANRCSASVPGLTEFYRRQMLPSAVKQQSTTVPG